MAVLPAADAANHLRYPHRQLAAADCPSPSGNGSSRLAMVATPSPSRRDTHRTERFAMRSAASVARRVKPTPARAEHRGLSVDDFARERELSR